MTTQSFLEGDDTDFSDQPERGRTTKPNDFSSYYLTKEEAEEEWIISGSQELLMKCRPYVSKHITTLEIMGQSMVVVVNLKEGVNLRDIRNIVEGKGSFGKNRSFSI